MAVSVSGGKAKSGGQAEDRPRTWRPSWELQNDGAARNTSRQIPQAEANVAAPIRNGHHVGQSRNNLKLGAGGSSKPVTRQLDLPASSWGVIIGKGGDMLRSLQIYFDVRVSVPRPNSSPGSNVTLRGTSDACDACEGRIQQLVQQMSREKVKGKQSKPKVGTAKKSKPKGDAANPFPAQCGLCQVGCTSLRMTFEHIGSSRHLSNVQARVLDHVPIPEVLKSILDVAALLADPVVRDLHEDLGYDVANLLDAAPRLEERRLSAIALREEVSRMIPDFEWLHVEDRWLSRWDPSSSTSGRKSMLLAPPIEEMLMCCIIDEQPPMVRMPRLPAPLPKPDPKLKKDNIAKGRHMWPFDPTSRLGIAVILKHGLSLDRFDVVCGTSFIKALSGDSSRTKDTYYLQRFRNTLCALHVPERFHNQDDAGHAVETLLCGSAGNGCSSYSSSTVRIGDYRVLVTSEVDARDDSGSVIELKSSSVKTGMGFVDSHVSLQVALNGSEYVLACGLDADKTQLLKTEWISSSDALQAHSAAFIGQGQRTRLLMERVFNHTCFERHASSTEMSCVMEMTFDDIKAPVIKPAGSEIGVLPEGLM